MSIRSKLGHLTLPINFVADEKLVGSIEVRTRNVWAQGQALCRNATLARLQTVYDGMRPQTGYDERRLQMGYHEMRPQTEHYEFGSIDDL